MRSYNEELLALRPTPKLEDHSLSAIRYCLLNLLAFTLHFGGRSSIRNPRTHHSLVKGSTLHGDNTHFCSKIFGSNFGGRIPMCCDGGLTKSFQKYISIKNFKRNKKTYPKIKTCFPLITWSCVIINYMISVHV